MSYEKALAQIERGIRDGERCFACGDELTGAGPLCSYCASKDRIDRCRRCGCRLLASALAGEDGDLCGDCERDLAPRGNAAPTRPLESLPNGYPWRAER